jgi:hypothetical protein
MFHSAIKTGVVVVLALTAVGFGTARLAPQFLGTKAHAAKSDATLPRVRHLEIKLEEPPEMSPVILVFTSQKEAEQGMGAVVAKQLGEQVDFTKEKVAFVRWRSFGPPFDTIEANVTKTDNGFELRIEQKNAPASPRSGALRVNSDFYAVPTSVHVEPSRNAG